jgi:hypothetical protein
VFTEPLPRSYMVILISSFNYRAKSTKIRGFNIRIQYITVKDDFSCSKVPDIYCRITFTINAIFAMCPIQDTETPA